MRQAPGPPPAAVTAGGVGGLAEAASALLAAPGLVVLTGGPGCGRSAALSALGDAFRGPVHAGGGLAMLRTVPAFALTRAVRVRLPVHDPALLAEAVRSRVRSGLLLLDDLQWADPLTLAALPAIAAHCRVAVALRTPYRLPGDLVAALRRAAAGWLPVPALEPAAAADLARRVAPALAPARVAEVVRRAGGVPLAVRALARHAASGADSPAAGPDEDQVAYAVAVALADLPRPARTAMAALGLLGRPAPAALLGAGTGELLAAGLVTRTVPPSGDVPGGDRAGAALDAPGAASSFGSAAAGGDASGGTSGGGEVAPVSPYVAEVAAGLLDSAQRAALHRRLAGLVPPREAVRHLAAAGDGPAAYALATAAARTATSGGERAELLLFACDLAQPPAGVVVEPAVRIAAARAALAAGRPRAAAQVVTATLGGQAAVLRGEALLQAGDPAAARDAVAPVPDDADPAVVAARDRVRLLTDLGTTPAGAAVTLPAVIARHGEPPAHPGLRAAVAAVRAARREPGWEYGLASAAAAAATAGDVLAARWSGWLLVETLAADGRLAEAAHTAGQAADACAADLAYGWQTRFLAARLWCTALRGDPERGTGVPDDVLRRAGDLTDRTLPPLARDYATAAAALLEADGGLLAPARARLAAAAPDPPGAGVLLDWVRREAAWLDGRPDQATAEPVAATGSGPPLVAGLRDITAHWAAHDAAGSAGAHPGAAGPAAEDGPGSVVPAVRETLAAWSSGAADGFTRAARLWRGIAVREEVRCLLAHGLHAGDRDRAVPVLLAAESLAERCGLVVLLGRVRRALRRHAVRRGPSGTGPSGTAGGSGELTGRERQVLRLVARGEPTRRIAGQLGISAETVETHIRAGMRKLGARTRTEAAARALEVLAG
ncbi:helix-turn-helix transcriptional regulator [Rhizomonospora bruguierae]|uniref:helix-turn-helix transcriptional regulator n=1 Tax=Rhizomonospora bruguierae TaxID=1581705 RepID=UPI0020BE744D|nr:LuxR C-terminal-related transcriptional regulator [Micromonospora sp. NBRC 107566]